MVFFDPSDDSLYVYSGMTNRNALDIRISHELWKWDGSGWTELDHFDEPSNRTFLGETFDTKRRRLMLFGGQKGDFISQAYNSTWALDLNTMTWSLVNDGAGGSTRVDDSVVLQLERLWRLEDLECDHCHDVHWHNHREAYQNATSGGPEPALDLDQWK